MQSKLEGENNILKNFPLATILRPSVVYSVEDNFTTSFMSLFNKPLFLFIMVVVLVSLLYIVQT